VDAEHLLIPSRGFPRLLLQALLLKAAFVALLVLVAQHEDGDARYLAPREGDANDVAYTLGRGFDAQAYQKLARQGYTDSFSRNYPLGFPLLVRAADALVGNSQVAAVLVANAMGVLALGLFFLVARHYAARAGVRPDGAVLLFAVLPGELAFGSVAYSESSFLVVSLLGWLAYLRAEGGAAGPGAAADGAVPRARSLAWLLLASLLCAASVMVRHLGAPVFAALLGIELLRVLRCGPGGAQRAGGGEAGGPGGGGGTGRSRAVLEACAVLWGALPLVAYFVWKFQAHDLGGLQEDIWSMHFAPLGAPASLLRLGVGVQNVVLIYLSLPLALLLLVRLRAVDGRLALVVACWLLLALSFTGLAAQSFTRYVWTFWPLALGALALRDRAVVVALGALLFLLSLWCGVGHALGTAAL